MVFLLILTVVLVSLKKSRIAESKAKKAAIQSQELNKKLQESYRDLEIALLRAESANSAKTTFLNNMSHDIRTPMNAIIGFTSLAASHVDNKNKVKEYLSKIFTSSEHLLSLINDILDMSRIESGKVKINENPLHLPDLLHDIRTIVQPNIASKQLDFLIDTVDVRDEDIIADKLRLTQILLNILSNGIKFNKMGGTITVKSEEGKGSEFTVSLSFKLSGEKKSYEKIDYLQGLKVLVADDDTDTCLSISSMLTEIGMRSEWTVSGKEAVIRVKHSMEIGDEFYAYIIDWLMPDMNGIETVRRIRRVIGDSKPIIILTAYDWSDVEEEAREAGVTAVDMVEQAVPGQYSLILLDIQMPIMNGYEAARRIRALKNPDIAPTPIVAMTANAFEEDREKSYEAGMNGHLAKPVSVETLMNTIYKFVK